MGGIGDKHQTHKQNSFSSILTKTHKNIPQINMRVSSGFCVTTINPCELVPHSLTPTCRTGNLSLEKCRILKWKDGTMNYLTKLLYPFKNLKRESQSTLILN